MTTAELEPVLAGAAGWTEAVSTGSCTRMTARQGANAMLSGQVNTGQ